MNVRYSGAEGHSDPHNPAAPSRRARRRLPPRGTVDAVPYGWVPGGLTLMSGEGRRSPSLLLASAQERRLVRMSGARRLDR